MDIPSSLQQLTAAIEAELTPKIRAQLLAEVRADFERDAAFLGLRLIDRDTVMKKLGWGRSSLERKMRGDPAFPQPKRFFGGNEKPQWLMSEIDDYIANGPL